MTRQQLALVSHVAAKPDTILVYKKKDGKKTLTLQTAGLPKMHLTEAYIAQIVVWSTTWKVGCHENPIAEIQIQWKDGRHLLIGHRIASCYSNPDWLNHYRIDKVKVVDDYIDLTKGVFTVV